MCEGKQEERIENISIRTSIIIPGNRMNIKPHFSVFL